jgi:hypothetical protein
MITDFSDDYVVDGTDEIDAPEDFSSETITFDPYVA